MAWLHTLRFWLAWASSGVGSLGPGEGSGCLAGIQPLACWRFGSMGSPQSGITGDQLVCLLNYCCACDWRRGREERRSQQLVRGRRCFLASRLRRIEAFGAQALPTEGLAMDLLDKQNAANSNRRRLVGVLVSLSHISPSSVVWDLRVLLVSGRSTALRLQCVCIG